MGRFKLKIGILTSSRADFGIYTPLISELSKDLTIRVEILAFGMHLQKSQGTTLNLIKAEYSKLLIHEIKTNIEDDSIWGISKSYGKIVDTFSTFWKKNNYDMIFALGDRWEMSAAVQSTIPLELIIGHIHGGETTLGAIDNIYRHQITLASKLHFTSCQMHSKRVEEIISGTTNIHNVGSLSIQDLGELKIPNWDLVKKQFGINFDDFILVTFHPESVNSVENLNHIKITKKVLKELLKTNNLLITNANSDAYGSLYNKMYKELENSNKQRIKVVSAMGRVNFFSAMTACEFILGNSSSALIESCSFHKWALNVGNRQKGRIGNSNVISTEFNYYDILRKVTEIKSLNIYQGKNIFFKPNSSSLIRKIIKEYFLISH